MDRTWTENEAIERELENEEEMERGRELGNGEEITLHCWQTQFTAFLVSVAKILTYAV